MLRCGVYVTLYVECLSLQVQVAEALADAGLRAVKLLFRLCSDLQCPNDVHAQPAFEVS